MNSSYVKLIVANVDFKGNGKMVKILQENYSIDECMNDSYMNRESLHQT